MKHIITVNGRPLEELTQEERAQLDQVIIDAFKKHTRIILRKPKNKNDDGDIV